LIFLLCLFLGCTIEIGTDDDPYSPIDDDTPYGAIKVVSVSPKELLKPVDDDLRAVPGGANDFAFRFGAVLAGQSGTKNLVCSPLSVWIPLAALVNAVNAQHKAALVTALGVPGLGETDINNGASRMLYDLTRQREKDAYEKGDYHDPIKIANAIFVDYDATIKKDFAQAFMDYFRGSSINVDFGSPRAVKEVNDWAGKHTIGMIPEIIHNFPSGTVAAIANAIYFFDRWAWEFDPNKTKEDIFYAPDGETTAFYMLREGNELTYYEDENLQAMPLRFNTGGGMYILLPKDGDAAGLLASLTNAYFSEIRAGSGLAKGKLLLPRFSIEEEVMSLTDILISLGIPLFEDGALPGVIQEGAVQLSDALQKAVIKVDEKGTTAAAVTVLLMDATSAGPRDPPEKTFAMICDKPFVFVLYDRTYNGPAQVLFTGMVNKP
jgi:serpin B